MAGRDECTQEPTTFPTHYLPRFDWDEVLRPTPAEPTTFPTYYLPMFDLRHDLRQQRIDSADTRLCLYPGAFSPTKPT